MSERHVITFRHRGRLVDVDCSCGFRAVGTTFAGHWARVHREQVGLATIAAARVLRW